MLIKAKKYSSNDFVYAEIDDCDYDLLKGMSLRTDSKGYVLYGVNKYIARVITGANDTNIYVDHIDGNPLNNKRNNLRLATNSQNQANRKVLSRNTSGYRGVTWNKASNKWQSQIKKDGKNIYLGVFDDPEEAYKSYKQAAELLFGCFAQHISEAA